MPSVVTFVAVILVLIMLMVIFNSYAVGDDVILFVDDGVTIGNISGGHQYRAVKSDGKWTVTGFSASTGQNNTASYPASDDRNSVNFWGVGVKLNFGGSMYRGVKRIGTWANSKIIM